MELHKLSFLALEIGRTRSKKAPKRVCEVPLSAILHTNGSDCMINFVKKISSFNMCLCVQSKRYVQ